MTKSSIFKALMLFLLEAPLSRGAFSLATKIVKKSLAPPKRPAVKAPVETRDTRYLTNTTPKERSLVELGYDKVMREDGGEDLVLTDASRYTMIADSPDDLEKKVYDNLSLDVFLDKDLLRLVERTEDYFTIPKKESRLLRLAKDHCEASDLMTLWVLHPNGERKAAITWSVGLNLEMTDPKEGFKISEISSSFGRKYDPQLNLKFDIERLRALENATKAEVPEPGAVLTNANLTELCWKQLIRYGHVLEQHEKIKPKILDPEFKADYLKGIVMWLLTGSYKTVPEDLQYKWTLDKSIRPHHQITVSGRTAERKEVTKEAK
ncbi:hypothetical protein FOL46_005585 [Perkinsus olseni]|nr:hypothetical protein FOL46_005585 [Perkinsus olseni]